MLNSSSCSVKKRLIPPLLLAVLIFVTGCQPKLLAIMQKRDFARANQMLQDGANVNAKDIENGYTALHYAAEKNDVEEIVMLLNWGADPEARSDKGWAPLHLAVINNHIDAARLLVHWGADVNVLSGAKKTPTHYSMTYNFRDISDFLQKNGGKVSLTDR